MCLIYFSLFKMFLRYLYMCFVSNLGKANGKLSISLFICSCILFFLFSYLPFEYVCETLNYKHVVSMIRHFFETNHSLAIEQDLFVRLVSSLSLEEKIELYNSIISDYSTTNKSRWHARFIRMEYKSSEEFDQDLKKLLLDMIKWRQETTIRQAQLHSGLFVMIMFWLFLMFVGYMSLPDETDDRGE